MIITHNLSECMNTSYCKNVKPGRSPPWLNIVSYEVVTTHVYNIHIFSCENVLFNNFVQLVLKLNIAHVF